MAEHLNVDTEALRSIAASFDDASIDVDQLALPVAVDGGIATTDIDLLLSMLSSELGAVAGGLDIMTQRLIESRQHYIDSDNEAAEAIFTAGVVQ